MPVLSNNAEGGTNGAAVNFVNSGGASGIAWNNVSTGTGATITYTTEHARGNLCYKITTGATTSTAYMAWEDSYSTSSMTTYLRFYIYQPALPSASTRLSELIDGAGNVCMTIGMTTAGKISIRDRVSASMILSASPLPVGKWARVEIKCVSSATNGQAELMIFSDSDSPYPLEKNTSTATFNTYGQPIGLIRLGVSSVSAPNVLYYLDDLAVSSDGYLGPANQAYLTPVTRVNTAEGGTNGTVIDSSNSGGISGDFFQRFAGNTYTDPAITFSNAQSAHGTMSYLVTPLDGASTYTVWSGFAANSIAVRAYVYFTGVGASTFELIQINSNFSGTAGELLCRVLMGTKLSLMDNTGTILWSATNTMPLNTWMRIEVVIAIGASDSTGSVDFVYYPFDSTTPVESFSTTSATLKTNAITIVRFGRISSNNGTMPFYLDDLAMKPNPSGFIGPYSGPAPTPPAPYAGIIPHLGWGTHL